MIRCMIGYAMIRCMIGLVDLIDVWLGMMDAMLIVRCILVCVCELDNNIECAFNRVKT